jgi:hypothetical protein
MLFDQILACATSMTMIILMLGCCWTLCILALNLIYNNNNHQAFYSQASWGRLEMKPHELKTKTKQERKRKGVKTKDDKKPNQKRRKDNKTLSQKVKRDEKKTLTKRQ